MSSFDVSAAFLEGEAEEKLYAELPPGTINDNKVHVRVEIQGNWYGEKQAGRVWNKKFDSIMKTLHMERFLTFAYTRPRLTMTMCM